MTPPTRVLLVDDEERLVLNLSRLLAARGFSVTGVHDGRQALEALRGQEPFDVIVLDLVMPGWDGLETLSRVKDLDPEVQVIMLTGQASVSSGITAMRLGAFDYLLKPVEIEELAAKIGEAREVETIRHRPVLWPRRKVAELTLSPAPRVREYQFLDWVLTELINRLGPEENHEIFVVDAGEALKGVITRQDLVGAANAARTEPPLSWNELKAEPGALPLRPAGEIMRPSPEPARPDEDLHALARRMIRENLVRLPVVDEGRLAGLARLGEILQYLPPERGKP